VNERSWATLRFVVALLALAGAHALLIVHSFGAALPLPEHAFSRGDFATHAAQVRRVLEAFEVSGQHWAYDVQLLAGAPNGVLFDADNKGWELWTWAWVLLGVGEGRAYNGFVLAIHAVMPVVVFASARLVRLDRKAALTSTGLAILLWSFDSLTRWLWFVGTVSYVFVAYFALLPLALFYRWIEDRQPRYALACALSLAFGHLLHPYIFFILLAPMLALYIRAGLIERDMSPVEHGITLAIAGLTVVVNGWWLRTALRFFHYILDSAYYERGGLSFLVYDLLGLLYDPSTQGVIGPRTAVRVLALLAALAGLRAWRRSADRRRLPFLVLIVTMAALAFVGGYTPAEQIQPYRHNLALGFAALIPAGWWLAEVVGQRPWRGLQPGPRALALIVAVLATLHLTRDVLYFFAGALPKQPTMDNGYEVPLNQLGHMLTPDYSYEGQPEWEGLIKWVTEHDDGQGRWLVQEQVLGEYLMARTQAQLIGGFMVRNIEHSDANWFRRSGLTPPYDPDALREYFNTYAIHWVIVHQAAMSPWWDQHPRLLSRAGAVDGMLIYMVVGRGQLIEGKGRVSASINRIEVSGTRPDQDLVLRYHWMETLRCVPDCRIEREPVPGDRVGFIRVPAPHGRDFVIENSYEW